jgi:signal transduction histidine kinase
MDEAGNLQSVARLPQNARLLLVAGFGGLLLLMAFAGLDAMRVFRDVQNRNDTIRREFLVRNRLLNQIRADLYLSGTYVRDYLLEPEAQIAEKHRVSLKKTRRNMEAALATYARQVSPGETQPFRDLQRELSYYWELLEPVMQWSPDQRKTHGYSFLRDDVFPRRMIMLGIADQIANVNEQQLTVGDQQVALLSSQVAVRLGAALSVTLVLGVLLALFSTRKVLELERQSRTRFREIADARAQLKELSARLVAAQESERRTISRELHDEVGQALSGLGVGLSNLAAVLALSAAPEVTRQVESLRKLAETTMGVVRNITLLLRPSMLDDLGLVPALQWQGREVSKRTGLVVRIASQGIPEDLPDEYNTCVYRVVQEALNNCARHASADSARVALRQEGDRLFLTIEDDGRGFRPDFERGLGLLGMQERVTHLEGTFDLKSEPGQGTLIAITLPLKHRTP